MIFGKDTKEWESLKGIFTATEINQQPATWRKTIKQVEDHKEEIKAFIENVTKHDDLLELVNLLEMQSLHM